MSVWVGSPDRSAPSLGRPQDRLTVSAGVAAVAIGVALLVGEGRFRVAEAGVSAWIIRVLHLRPANSLGTNVLFPIRGRWVGFSLSFACTAALLMTPFFVVAGLLMLSGRVERRRGLVSLAITAVLIFAVNQLRLLVIAGSMVLWGFRTGYERSHILLGTILSTIGVIVGIIVFVWMLVVGPDQQRRRQQSRRRV